MNGWWRVNGPCLQLPPFAVTMSRSYGPPSSCLCLALGSGRGSSQEILRAKDTDNKNPQTQEVSPYFESSQSEQGGLPSEPAPY